MYKLLVTAALVQYILIISYAIYKNGKSVNLKIIFYIALAILGTYAFSFICLNESEKAFSYFKTINLFVFFLSFFSITFLINTFIINRIHLHSWLSSFFDIIGFIILSITSITISNIDYPILTKRSVYAIFQTNIRESYEFIKTFNISLIQILLYFTLLTMVVFLIIKLNTDFYNKIKKARFSSKIYYLMIYFAFILCVSYIYTPIRNILTWSCEYKEYLEETENSSRLSYKPFIVSENLPKTIVIIIGESLSRSYMSVYGYPQKTTPHLEKYVNDSTLLMLKESYACDIQTIQVVPRILTDRNQYHPYKSYDLIDILKINQYKTWWISNQEEIGIYDTPVSIIAEKADISSFRPYNNPMHFDSTLLPQIEKALTDNIKNKVLFIHLMGSHSLAANQYPHIAPYLRKSKYSNEKIYHYENSVLYNDQLIYLILQLLHKHSDDFICFYTSDHGDNPLFRRDADNPKLEVFKVPAFIQLSSKYIKRHPRKYQNLKNNLSKPWSNDLTFDLILGLLNIHKVCYNADLDLSSSKYNITPTTIRLMSGKFSIVNDSLIKNGKH